MADPNSGTNWPLILTAAAGLLTTVVGTGGVTLRGSERLEEANNTRIIGITFLATQLEQTQKQLALNQTSTLMIYNQKEELAAELREVRERYEALLVKLAER